MRIVMFLIDGPYGPSCGSLPALSVQRIAGTVVEDGKTFIATHRYNRNGKMVLMFHTERYEIGKRVFSSEMEARTECARAVEQWLKRTDTIVKRTRKKLEIWTRERIAALQGGGK